jgi:hypothetical protein
LVLGVFLRRRGGNIIKRATTVPGFPPEGMIVELNTMKRNDAGNTHRINLGLGTHKAGGVKAEATEELATTEGDGGPGHPVLFGED